MTNLKKDTEYFEKYKIRVTNWEDHQHYKKKNKNFNNEQPWFMFYGRKLLRDMKFMQLTPEQRDFLIVGCWAVGSQDNGFLPEINQHAFWLRRDVDEVSKYIDFLLEEGWLERWSIDSYDEIQDEQEIIIQDNRKEYSNEYWDKKRYEEAKKSKHDS